MTGKEFLSSNKKKSSSGFWIRFSLLIFFFITVSAGVGLAYFYKFSSGSKDLSKYKEIQAYIKNDSVKATLENDVIYRLKNFKASTFKQTKYVDVMGLKYYESQYKSSARESISLCLDTLTALLVITILSVLIKRKMSFAKMR